MCKKNLLGIGAIICTVLSAVFLKDITIGFVAVPMAIGLFKMRKEDWDNLQKRG